MAAAGSPTGCGTSRAGSGRRRTATRARCGWAGGLRVGLHLDGRRPGAVPRGPRRAGPRRPRDGAERRWRSSVRASRTWCAPGCTSRTGATATRSDGCTRRCSAPIRRWRRWSSCPGCCIPTCASRSRSRRCCRTGRGRMTGTDSAGTPWAGRALSGTGVRRRRRRRRPDLAGRTGGGPPATVGGGRRAAGPGGGAARWLVPVVAVLDEGDDGAHGHTVDQRTDMAAGDAHRSGRPARAAGVHQRRGPRRVGRHGAAGAGHAARAAQAAVAEGCHVAVVDLGGEAPTELRPSMLWALAQETEWHPAHTDPFVAQSVSRAVAEEGDILTHRLEEGEPPGSGVLRVVLGLPAGMPADVGPGPGDSGRRAAGHRRRAPGARRRADLRGGDRRQAMRPSGAGVLSSTREGSAPRTLSSTSP